MYTCHGYKYEYLFTIPKPQQKFLFECDTKYFPYFGNLSNISLCNFLKKCNFANFG